MKTRHIILGLGLLGAGLTAVVGGIGWGGLYRVTSAVELSTVANQATQEATLGDMMHEGVRGDVYAALFHAQRGNAQGVTHAQQEAQAHGKEFVERVAALRALDLPADQAQAAATLAPIVQRYADMGMALSRQAGSDLDGANGALPAFDALFEQLATVQDALIQRIEDHQRQTQAQAQGEQRLASRAMLLATLLGAVGLSALSLGVARHLMRTLGGEPSEVRRLLHRVAGGDLAVEVPVKPGDERSVVAGIAEMVAHLRGTVTEVRDSAAGLSGAAQEVSAGSSDLAQRTSAQAAALDASLASLGEMSQLVEQSAGHASQASALVREATSVADRSGEAVQAVVQTMQGIEQSSRRISEIIGVIDGIAFQTNILALNAAVEAARAGEQGRGFAVVAGEVRALAQRSASAAQEIKGLIEDSVRQVGQGSSHVATAGDTMQQLAGSVGRVAALVDEVAGATAQQSQGLQTFTGTVRELEGLTQQNAALVEQSAASAGSLGEQAGRLNGAVGRFRVER